MEKKDIRDYYKERIEELSTELDSRKAKVKYFVTAEILLFITCVAMGVAYFSGYIETVAFLSAACLVQGCQGGRWSERPQDRGQRGAS